MSARDFTREYLERALKRMAQEAPPGDGALVRRLLFLLRPPRRGDIAAASTHLADLLGLVERDPAYATALRDHLLALLEGHRLGSLLMDSGVLPVRDFRAELSRRLRFKWLPPLPEEESLRDWLEGAFERADETWIGGIDAALWLRLLVALRLEEAGPQPALEEKLRNAINGLSHRLAAGGLDPELLRLEPDLQRHASPFLAQHEEIHALLNSSAGVPDAAQARVLLDQCREILDRLARRSRNAGTSVAFSHLRIRLLQQIGRLETLLEIFAAHGLARAEKLVALFVALAEAAPHRHSVRDLLSDTTAQLAYQITQHAGQTGEHYVAESRTELWRMFRSAAGAGPIIAAMALLKILALGAHLPPLQEAVLVSLDYALGFVLIYLLGLTVATKQPAMTASWMARQLAGLASESSQSRALGSFVGRVFNTQFVAILGNLLLAFAGAALFAWGLHRAGQFSLATAQAQGLIAQASLLDWRNTFYAALAGVGLFLSGVVSGYYDNKAVYEHIPARLARLTWPPRIIGEQAWQAVAAYLGRHLGGLAGNMFFGFYLGLLGAFGHMAGLPLDIRHIAFASANLAYGLGALDWRVSGTLVAATLGGVLVIGLTNLLVSFALAFYVALRASHIERRHAGRWVARALIALALHPWRTLRRVS